MSNTVIELAEFQKYVLARMQLGGDSASLDEMFDEWRLRNPSLEDARRDTLAVAASLRDLDGGAAARPAVDVIADIKTKFGFGT